MMRAKVFIPGNRVGVVIVGTVTELPSDGSPARVEVESIAECRVDGWPKQEPDSKAIRAWLCEIGMLGGTAESCYAITEAHYVEVLGVAASKDQIGLFGSV